MKKKKFSVKEKVALAVFMEAVPSIIALWKRTSPEVSFDNFCQSQYDLAKAQKKEKNKTGEVYNV